MKSDCDSDLPVSEFESSIPNRQLYIIAPVGDCSGCSNLEIVHMRLHFPSFLTLRDLNFLLQHVVPTGFISQD
jgi:hypothetical protein